MALHVRVWVSVDMVLVDWYLCRIRLIGTTVCLIGVSVCSVFDDDGGRCGCSLCLFVAVDHAHCFAFDGVVYAVVYAVHLHIFVRPDVTE